MGKIGQSDNPCAETGRNDASNGSARPEKGACEQQLRAGFRFLGIDVGAETIKVVEVVKTESGLQRARSEVVEHLKEPGRILLELLSRFDWGSVHGAAVTGRLSRLVSLPRIPLKQAQARACRFLFGDKPFTIVSIGSHGFSVLELRGTGLEVYRENSRCSQGTGNFLRQLTERFDLTVEQASEISADVPDPAPLSGRCPVILKTDMTHLANKGEDRARILAGLFDAVCANVLNLVKPRLSPPDVLLIGGVSRSRRVRAYCEKFLSEKGLRLRPIDPTDAVFFEALGAAIEASENEIRIPELERLLEPETEVALERVPPLANALKMVRHLEPPARVSTDGSPRPIILGFDIGSTGSKLVAMDVEKKEMLWEAYRRTGGNPVGAAQDLMKRFTESHLGTWPVVAIGVTGSGREIVGSLMITCYGHAAVFIMNEIVAHAEGALHYDPRVDTIFEIGGQDAKYIRLAGGRVVDCAMNEACSAGTGSFIEEQGRKFAGLEDVVALGRTALTAPSGVSLGQHCSVFMAEVIDEAVASGVEQSAIIAGLYDSIIQNYLNRVKGCRSVGQVVFCQGMPFSADALAAAVARQTGSEVIVPPSPGTVGALGIALLARRFLSIADLKPLDVSLFLGAKVEQKTTFVCKSTVGCGGAGNKCKIDSLKTVVGGHRQVFNWGGACSLYDKGVRKAKLPDRSPDPFREREELVQRLVAERPARNGHKSVAITDEFTLKGLFPFFAAFLYELGLDLKFFTGADHETLKQGIQEANVPFCAPMQLFHGLVSRMSADNPDLIFLPMLINLPAVRDEKLSKTCPIVQAAPDVISWGVGLRDNSRVISPIIQFGPGNLDSSAFVESCRKLAETLRASNREFEHAFAIAQKVQQDFDVQCIEVGRRALVFCEEHGVPPVVVLGRPYTIYNRVLNSNVPALLREQGAMAIPIDCYPVGPEQPVFPDIYWGYGQRILRAAHQIRRSPGVYGIYASNYSCGPDSFNLHFCTYVMDGKPFAVIETDGHSGDAGTKTRVEAFLHCVREDRHSACAGPPATDFDQLGRGRAGWNDVRKNREHVLIPRMGVAAQVVAACFRGAGIDAETLPMPDREAVRMGRRYTSGKECLPMCVTLGSLLQRLEREQDRTKRFVFLMPRATGPCRFGVYHMLDQVVVERLGLKDRVRIWSPNDVDYYEGLPQGFRILLYSGVTSADCLLQALLDVRPVEKARGAANEIYKRYLERLLNLLERAAADEPSQAHALWQAIGGELFGLRNLLRDAANEFAAVKSDQRLPTVLVVGEIYVRLDPFSNDFIIDKLEQRGIRARLAPTTEWLEYVEECNLEDARGIAISQRLATRIQERISDIAYYAFAGPLGWPERAKIRETLQASSRYIRPALRGEAVLTFGGPVHEWHRGDIDAVVSVGPLECMPNKIAEAQFFHAAEQEKLLSLTLSVNGDPIALEVLDSFAFEVHARFAKRQAQSNASPRPVAEHLYAYSAASHAPEPACACCTPNATKDH